MASYPSTTTVVDSDISAVAKSQGAAIPFVIEREYDLDTLISGKLANADVVNLFSLAAGHVILATRIKITEVAVGCSSTCTLKLRFGTTDIGATADILTDNTVATGGAATVALPLTNGITDTLVNLVAAIGGGTTTVNPTVQVRMLVCSLA
jgi:hypothetical protein